MGQRGAFRVENAKAVIAPVGDVDVAVGIDRHVGGVIKNPRLGVSRRVRVRDERTQIGHGEGILRYRKRPVFADRHDELAAWGELLHAVVLPVRDIDVALVVEGDAPRLVELSPSPLPFLPHWVRALPSGVKTCRRSLPLSTTITLPPASQMIPAGFFNSPGPLPGVPHLRMNLPAASKTETVFVHSSVTYTVSCLSTATPNGQMECPSVSPYVANSASSSSSPGPPIFTRLTRIANVFSLPRLATKMSPSFPRHMVCG